MQNCNKCNVIKPFDTFELRSDTGRYRNTCKICTSEIKRQNYIKNRNIILQKHNLYRQSNKDKLKEKDKNKYIKNKDKILQHMKIYRSINKIKMRMQKAVYYKNNKRLIKNKTKLYRYNNKTKRNKNRLIRIQSDPNFRIRENISASIRNSLKRNNGSKNGLSILKHLSYTIQDLKQHLESKFELWMTWENYGKYNVKTWNDQDSSTWKWNIDHIVPHSIFKYNSMNEENFKKCWNLNNLRPFSAKQNYLDGSNRVRHKGN